MASVSLDSREPINNANIKHHINDPAKRSGLHYAEKLAETITLHPITTTATLLYRIVKFLTWIPAKAALYEVRGRHAEVATYFESQYLKTLKAVRDVLFIPSVAKRAFEDMVAKNENYVDDIETKHPSDYLKVSYTKSFHQYSSYLHGIGTFEVTQPQGIGELPAISDPSLKAVMASHFLNPGMMAINFGCPNVSTFITKKKVDGSVQTVQIDAKSLRREAMTYHNTNGKIQSGVFFVPTNLPKEALERFNDAAVKMQGRRDITCVNTNCRVLKEAGFSIENVDMDGVVFPTTLMEHLMFRNVFYTDSQGMKHKVHFDILNTTPHSLEEYSEVVDTAVVGSQQRHHRRNADTEDKKNARAAEAKTLIEKEKENLSKTPPAPRVNDEDLGKRKVTVSVPSLLGNTIARIWGRHTMFEVDLSDKRKELSEAFNKFAEQSEGKEQVKLHPFPQKKISFGTKLKKYAFFSGPMIRFLRRHMMGEVNTVPLSTQDLFDHLKSTEGGRLNYALLDDKVVFAKTHANGKSGEKLRKIADWALSKHALLAGRQDVYCSGEIRYDKKTNTFVINNDSGTYLPSGKRAAVVAKLANEIFNTQRFNTVFTVEDKSVEAPVQVKGE